MMAAGVLVLAPQAQSQTPPRDCNPVGGGGQLCLEKTANPTTVTVGEQITFTVRFINETPRNITTIGFRIVDVVPPEVRIDSVSQSVTPPGIGGATCTASGNTVTCPGPFLLPPGGEFTLTIVATPTQPGDFVNTAVFAPGRVFELNVEAPFTVRPAPVQGQQPQGQQPQGGGARGGGGTPAPITQEGEQDSESGEVDQSFDVS